jgi:DNA-binding FadR family transcriptional regulator
VAQQANVSALHDSVLTGLGTQIVSGHLPPGHVINLDGVSAQHGVSRSVAREAIRVLDPRVIRWRLGSSDRAAQLVSLSELRRGFEPAAAALAAQRANPHHCRIMAAAVSDMVVHGRSGDLESYLLADKVFHQTLLEASGNEMFRALNGVVAEILTGRTHHGLMPETPNPVAIALHDEVARAIRLRDEAGAERAMRAIIDEAKNSVTPPSD